MADAGFEAAEVMEASQDAHVEHVEYLHTAFLGPVVDHKGITHIDIWIKLSAYKKLLESGKSWNDERNAFIDDTTPAERQRQLKQLDELWPIMEEWGKCWTEIAEHLKNDVYPKLNQSQRKTYVDTFTTRPDDPHKLKHLDRALKASAANNTKHQALQSLMSSYEHCLSCNFALGLLFCSFLARQYTSFPELIAALRDNLDCLRESLDEFGRCYLMPYLTDGADTTEPDSDADLLTWMLPFDYFIYTRYRPRKQLSRGREPGERILFKPDRLEAQRTDKHSANFTESRNSLLGNRFSWVPADQKEDSEKRARDIWEQLGPGWESKEPEGLRRRAPHNRSGSRDDEDAVSESPTGTSSARQEQQRDPPQDSSQSTVSGPSATSLQKQSMKPGLIDIGYFFGQAPCLIFVPSMVIVVLASFITGVSYTAVNGDASGGFTVAAWILGVGAFILTPMYTRHLNGCECLRWLKRQKSDPPGDRSV